MTPNPLSIKKLEKDLLLPNNWTQGQVQTTDYLRQAGKNAVWVAPLVLFFGPVLVTLLKAISNGYYSGDSPIFFIILLLIVFVSFMQEKEDGSILRCFRNAWLYWRHVRSRIELDRATYRSGSEVGLVMTSSQSRNADLAYVAVLNYVHEVEVVEEQASRLERRVLHTLPIATPSAQGLARGIRFTLPYAADGKALLTRMSKTPGARYWEVLITQPTGPFYARAVLQVW